MNDASSFRKKLLAWFSREKRVLPWRSSPSPYKTWISEMMLQQTQIKTALPYFERWVRELPDVRALDAASEHKVLSLWQGLGYYSRARQLKKAAAHLVARHGGELPRTLEAMLEVPGIGPYSAGAILSIAFGVPVPAVDGNVLRVFSRLYAMRDPIDTKPARDLVRDRVAALMPREKCGDFTEALMELGAMVCVPQAPLCGACPVAAFCEARKRGIQAELPVKSKKTKVEKVSACAAVLERGGKWFLWRRPVGSIMGGLWEFPEWKLPEAGAAESVRRELIASALKMPAAKLKYRATIRRTYTRFSEDLAVFDGEWKKPEVPNPAGWESRWLSRAELDEYPLTSAHAKIRKLVLEAR